MNVPSLASLWWPAFARACRSVLLVNIYTNTNNYHQSHSCYRVNLSHARRFQFPTACLHLLSNEIGPASALAVVLFLSAEMIQNNRTAVATAAAAAFNNWNIQTFSNCSTSSYRKRRACVNALRIGTVSKTFGRTTLQFKAINKKKIGYDAI